MDKKGFISIEYLFSIFILLIIALGLLFFTSASIESSKNIENNVQYRLILDHVASIINQVNSNGNGYSIYLHLDSKPGFYMITVEKNKLTIESLNRKGQTIVLPLKIDSKYKLHSGKSYLVTKQNDGKIVIK
ncbi:hypothetical protein [uncultured Methanobrevibacter sp.]|uniref:hypothetical protein n=1 Tax=uncultured Methanobrevibacter sp. TaxID=253161 RepID=UPI0025DBE089|nr:hypothetical protein [uncultured Methanobrevibacter sp.]